MTDPELQPAVDQAVRELARRLRPVTTLRNVEAFAATFVADMRTEGWRPPLRPRPATRQLGTGVPPTQHADELGAARQAAAAASRKLSDKARRADA